MSYLVPLSKVGQSVGLNPPDGRRMSYLRAAADLEYTYITTGSLGAADGCSLVAWVKINSIRSGAVNRIIGTLKTDLSAYQGWQYNASGVFRNLYNGGNVTAEPPPLDTWIMLYTTMDGTNLICGWMRSGGHKHVQVTAGYTTTGNWEEGGWSGNDSNTWCDGWCAEFFVYDRALSNGELLSCANFREPRTGLLRHMSGARTVLGSGWDSVTAKNSDHIGPYQTQFFPVYTVKRRRYTGLPWTRQPPAGTPLDFSNEIVKHMTGHFPLRRVVSDGSGTKDERNTTGRNAAVTNYVVDTNNTIVRTTTQRGESLTMSRAAAGSTSRLEIARQSNMDTSASVVSAFSFSLWFRVRSDQTAQVHFLDQFIDGDPNASQFFFGMEPAGDTLNVRLRHAGNNWYIIAAGPTINDDKWHMGTVTWQGNPSTGKTATLYLDGVSVGTASGSDALKSNSLNFTVFSCDSGANYAMDGELSELCWFHNYVLSPAQVRSLYNNQWQIYKPLPVFPLFDWQGRAPRNTFMLLGVS